MKTPESQWDKLADRAYEDRRLKMQAVYRGALIILHHNKDLAPPEAVDYAIDLWDEVEQSVRYREAQQREARAEELLEDDHGEEP